MLWISCAPSNQLTEGRMGVFASPTTTGMPLIISTTSGILVSRWCTLNWLVTMYAFWLRSSKSISLIGTWRLFSPKGIVFSPVNQAKNSSLAFTKPIWFTEIKIARSLCITSSAKLGLAAISGLRRTSAFTNSGSTSISFTPRFSWSEVWNCHLALSDFWGSCTCLVFKLTPLSWWMM